jgi:hypothetical protein
MNKERKNVNNDPETDVTRSQNRDGQKEAGRSPSGDEKRPEGSKKKGSPPHRKSNQFTDPGAEGA